jgi:hypothetical protein
MSSRKKVLLKVIILGDSGYVNCQGLTDESLKGVQHIETAILGMNI